MRLIQLLNKYSWYEIWNNLVKLYPDQEDNSTEYRNAYTEIMNLRPKKTTAGIWLYTDKEGHVSVSGYLLDKPEENWYAIEMVDWTEWINMPILEDTIKNYSELDIIVHCLWEMTAMGFTEEEIQSTAAELESEGAQIQQEFEDQFGSNNEIPEAKIDTHEVD